MSLVGPVGPDEVPPGNRGLIEGLSNPRPIGRELPAIYQEDEFCQRLTSAFDEALAPVFATIDCCDSYFDPLLAPDDLVDWLASWVGIDADETWSIERRRRRIQDAVTLYRQRGTVAGLAAHVAVYAGEVPDIEESGGCGWSTVADSPVPGTDQPHLIVRLAVDDPSSVNRSTLERMIGESRPAHLPYELQIGRRPDRPGRHSARAAVATGGQGDLPPPPATDADANWTLGDDPVDPASPGVPGGPESPKAEEPPS